jgi:hypothetical protein
LALIAFQIDGIQEQNSVETDFGVLMCQTRIIASSLTLLVLENPGILEVLAVFVRFDVTNVFAQVNLRQVHSSIRNSCHAQFVNCGSGDIQYAKFKKSFCFCS